MIPLGMIQVKYIGKWDAMTVDFNGKRYCFRAKDRISIVPSAVYDHIKSQRDLMSSEIIPYQEPEPVEVEEAPEADEDILPEDEQQQEPLDEAQDSQSAAVNKKKTQAKKAKKNVK